VGTPLVLSETHYSSLGLLNSFNPSSSVSGQSPTILTTSADISSWAATLPAGTKVTVTNYDASKKHGKLELIATPAHTETIIVTQQKTTDKTTASTLQQQLPVSSSLIITTSSPHLLPVSSQTHHPLPQFPTAKNIISNHNNNNKVVIGLAPVIAGAITGNSSTNQLLHNQHHHSTHLYHSQEALNLFSSIGVPNYTESFAVDPNEILHKEKFIKSEPSTPTPKPAEFQPVFHNVRVPTKDDLLLFKMEPLSVESDNSFHIKQEEVEDEGEDVASGHLVVGAGCELSTSSSVTTTTCRQPTLMCQVVVEEEGDIVAKKVVRDKPLSVCSCQLRLQW